MRESLRKILSHRKTYYSQSGEDGVLEYMLSKLPKTDKWCVEFGAWDGKHLSNTYHFISSMGYKAVLIEGETDRWKTLKSNMEKFGSICLNMFVDFDGENTLDKILSRTSIPKDFDLLSIDIDSVDYQVWEALKLYTPKLVIIEINMRDKPTVERINPPGSPYQWGVSGSSIKSIDKLAKSKGYSLVANVSSNAIFVKDELLYLFHDKAITPEECFLFEGHSYNELTHEERKQIGNFKVAIKYLKQVYKTLFR